MSDDYEIGYRKPPKSTRFKKGASGNPKGRPKGAKNLKTDLTEEMNESIVIRESGRSRKISKRRAIVKTLVNETLQRDNRAANTLVNLLLRVVNPAAEETPASPSLNAEERSVLETLKARLLDDALSDPQLSKDPNGTGVKP